MPEHLQSVLHSPAAVVAGGREGRARSPGGRLVVDLSVPEPTGGSAEPGTNPEELFAAGYPACFPSALLPVAAAARGEPA
jgi:osmotically inducible protein OsmC